MAYVLALHIIFVVCWFAGLFYIVRLFIYALEANAKAEPERSILQKQFHLMQKRLLYGITWPSGILTIIFGSWLLFGYCINDLKEPWFHLKLLLVGILVLYHLQCQLIFKQQSRGVYKFSSMKLRLFNEVATIVLFGVVFLVEVRRNTNWVYAILGTFALMALIFFGTLIYRSQRLKKENAEQKNTQAQNKNQPPPVS